MSTRERTKRASARIGNIEVRKKTNPTFRFVVEINGKAIAAFTQCVLPTIEWDVLEIQEGGLNTHVHQLPGRRRKNTLTLKNGVGLTDDLMKWYSEAMLEKFTSRKVTIIFLANSKIPVMRWDIEHCIPIKWTGPELRADSNSIAVQTLELACGQVTWSMGKKGTEESNGQN